MFLRRFLISFCGSLQDQVTTFCGSIIALRFQREFEPGRVPPVRVYYRFHALFPSSETARSARSPTDLSLDLSAYRHITVPDSCERYESPTQYPTNARPGKFFRAETA